MKPMKTYAKTSLLGLAAALAGAPSLAANSVVIEQVGAGSVVVKQSGKGNSVEIRQNAEKLDDKEDKKVKKPVDYNKEVINDPAISLRARGQSVIEKNTPAAPAQGNKIQVHQEGDSNKASLSQQGEDNELLLEQEGDNNQYQRVQKGAHNRAKVKQNGEWVEDVEENEE